jgi:hypothetical protein
VIIVEKQRWDQGQVKYNLRNLEGPQRVHWKLIISALVIVRGEGAIEDAGKVAGGIARLQESIVQCLLLSQGVRYLTRLVPPVKIMSLI